MTCNKKFPRNI